MVNKARNSFPIFSALSCASLTGVFMISSIFFMRGTVPELILLQKCVQSMSRYVTIRKVVSVGSAMMSAIICVESDDSHFSDDR